MFNALVAKKESPEQYGQLFDTISICLSKGLGAPIGSMLIGSKEFINKAIRIRKILGGGMRQVGYLAACGIYALENNIKRLNTDHLKAKEIEYVLSCISIVKKVEKVETNIVIFEINSNVSSELFLNMLNKKITIMR